MQTFIIAAITADGYVGQDAGHLSTRWTTRADKLFFTQKTKEAGACLFGRNTYETFRRALPGRRTIVYTTRPESVTAQGVETINGTPEEVVAALQRTDVQSLAICGGAQVYAQFLAAELVDEFYLTVHPIVFGAGVPLLNQPLERRLHLVETKDIGDETVLLHYAAIKPDDGND